MAFLNDIDNLDLETSFVGGVGQEFGVNVEELMRREQASQQAPTTAAPIVGPVVTPTATAPTSAVRPGRETVVNVGNIMIAAGAGLLAFLLLRK